MKQAKEGDKVQVHYTGKLADGTVFDSSEGQKPLSFLVGEYALIPLFEQAVIGMSEGETKTITIPADDAYGPHQEEKVVAVDRQNFPPHIEPEVGLELEAHQNDGTIFPLTVIHVSEEVVTMDANHPLAGKDLTFDIELVEIA